jgi:uncharacterized spore protein YtfJ
METNFDQLFNTLSDRVKSMANTDTVIGEEFTLGEFTCKPVIKLGVGFGAGSGISDSGKGHKMHKGGKQDGTGGGAGIGISPVGFLVAKGDEITFIPSGEKKGLAAVFDKVPDLMEKAMEYKKQQQEEEKKD